MRKRKSLSFSISQLLLLCSQQHLNILKFAQEQMFYFYSCKSLVTDGHLVTFNRIKQLCEYRTSLQGKNSVNIPTATIQWKLPSVFNLFLVWTKGSRQLRSHVLERRVPCWVSGKPEQRIVANNEQQIVRTMRRVWNSANNGEQSRIVANRSKWGTQNLGVNLAATWNGIFPAKKHRCFSGHKVFLNVISQGFNHCKSVNTSLLGYPCVFCFLNYNVSDGQPQPES